MGISHSKQKILVGAFLAYRYYLVRNGDGNANLKGILQMVAENVKGNVILSDIIGLWVLNELYYTLRYVLRLNFRELYDYVGQYGYKFVMLLAPQRVASLQSKIESDLRSKLKHSSANSTTNFLTYKQLPAVGRPSSEIISELESYHSGEVDKWKSGKVSGAVYHGGDEHIDLLNRASNLYHVTNPLHPDLFPSVMKFEAEVCSMASTMMNGGDENVCGSITSGGTESVIMATKAHRSFGYQKGITRPEIICCTTAHAAIDKACDILGIRIVRVPCDDKTFQIDLSAVKRALTNDTIMIYSSAPGFPSGIIDDIKSLSKIAKSHGCGLHVDCCLGGFYLPFLKKLPNVTVPEFDFGLPGVTTMSCDTHKYGYATKGTSVVLFRNKEWRHHMYFSYPHWTGGLYVTPSTAGSRPGSLIAACWASMMKLGEDGYIEATRKINSVTKKFVEVLKSKAISGVSLVGEPIAMVVGFRSDQFSIYDLSDKMAHRGYSLSNCQKPALVHICFTLRHAEPGAFEALIKDMKECAAECMQAVTDGKKKKSSGTAPVYGMASSLPSGPVTDMLNTYTDIVLEA